MDCLCARPSRRTLGGCADGASDHRALSLSIAMVVFGDPKLDTPMMAKRPLLLPKRTVKSKGGAAHVDPEFLSRSSLVNFGEDTKPARSLRAASLVLTIAAVSTGNLSVALPFKIETLVGLCFASTLGPRCIS